MTDAYYLITRFRCHAGHTYTLGTLLLGDSRRELAERLWVALRMREERKNLLRNLASQAGVAAPDTEAKLERIVEFRRPVNRLREFLLNGLSAPLPPGNTLVSCKPQAPSHKLTSNISLQLVACSSLHG